MPYTASDYECGLLNVEASDPPTLYRAPADDHGYQGRTGIYELVQVDSTMRTMIHDGAGEHELERHARTLGPSIREDGMRKVLAGTTTLEEVVRVTRADSWAPTSPSRSSPAAKSTAPRSSGTR